MNILITGVAGFIGFSLSRRLLLDGHELIGLDNINNYYDVNLKINRLKILGITLLEDKVSYRSHLHSNFRFEKMDLLDFNGLSSLFQSSKPDLIIHLAAQAGVRFSIQNPRAYLESNVLGYFNVLEAMRIAGISKIMYASSSSVYGNCSELPFCETQVTDKPVSFYAASKKSNELFTESYVNVHNLSAVGLRFFTVYGPYGRPDMAYFSFVRSIEAQTPVKIFNHGNLSRDFTYIDDVVMGISELANKFNETLNEANHQIFNIGNSSPVGLLDFLNIIENLLGKKAIVENVSMQLGDVYSTYANVDKLMEYTGYKPTTSLREGLSKYVSWYISYYNKLN